MLLTLLWPSPRRTRPMDSPASRRASAAPNGSRPPLALTHTQSRTRPGGARQRLLARARLRYRRRAGALVARGARAHRSRCTLAYWHRLRSAPGRYGDPEDTARVQPLWRIATEEADADAAPQDGEARGEPRAAPLCPGPPVGGGAAPGRDHGRRAAGEVGRSPPRSADRSALGAGVEPGADLQPAAPGLPR